MGRRSSLPWRRATGAAAVAVLLAGCVPPPGSGAADDLADLPLPEPITVTSPAWAEGERIPVAYTCDGEALSPPLAWEGVPPGTAEVAIVVDDPDTRDGTFVEWVVTGIDPRVGDVPEGGPVPGVEHRNSAGRREWTGPCPFRNQDHTFRFRVYALGAPVAAQAGARLDTVLGQIEDAATARGTLTGRYRR